MESRRTSIAVESRFKVVPFEEFCEIAHVGHSRGYEFLNLGDVKSVLVGRRRLVLIQSWYDYLERVLEEQRTFTRLPRVWRGSGPSRSAGAQELIEVQGRVHQFPARFATLEIKGVF